MKEILLVLTGGTICSFGDEKNQNRNVSLDKAERLIINNFRKLSDEYSDTLFKVDVVLDTLSENMTVDKWNCLIDYFSKKDLCEYHGVIITHGTDTLAYTSALLALLLRDVKIPVFVVSSNLPLNMENANGNENFLTAVQCIYKGILPGVYVSYRNSDGKMYIHKASRLLQCGNYSEDFYSNNMIKTKLPVCDNSITSINKNFQKTGKCNKDRMDSFGKLHFSNYNMNDKKLLLKNNVLNIIPYVGLDYSKINLEGVAIVVHNMYHSMTACVVGENDITSPDSLLYFLKKCNEKGVLVFVSPCKEDEADYVSGAEILRNGAVAVYGMTLEMTYVKAVIAAALYEDIKDIVSYMKSDICGEFIIG